MSTDTFRPLQQSRHIPVVDVLRGWALLGVVAMNYFDISQLIYPHQTHQGTTEKIVNDAASILFSSKSWTLLSFLFGYGFAVTMQHARQTSANGDAFFLRRMLLLLLLALFNSMFFFGDILKDYAVLGILLIFFNRGNAKTSSYIGLFIFLIIPSVAALVPVLFGSVDLKTLSPYVPLFKSNSLFDAFKFGLIGTWKGQVTDPNCAITVHSIMFCCFLMGQAAQKSDFFRAIENKPALLKRIWLTSFIITVIGTTLSLTLTRPVQMKRYFDTDYWLALITMVFFATSICRLYFSKKMIAFFILLQPTGKMTLSSYLAQNIISLLLFSGFGFGAAVIGSVPQLYCYLIALIIFAAQLFLNRWWLTYYYFGPVEWLWRRLSYGTPLPFKRNQAQSLA